MKSRDVFFWSLGILTVSCGSTHVPLQNSISLSEVYKGTYQVFMIDSAPIQEEAEPLGNVVLTLNKKETAAHYHEVSGTMQLNGDQTFQVAGTMDCVEHQDKACLLKFKATAEDYVYQVEANVVGHKLLQGQMLGYSLVPPADILQSYQLKAMRE